jgi:hypothetical protein
MITTTETRQHNVLLTLLNFLLRSVPFLVSSYGQKLAFYFHLQV